MNKRHVGSAKRSLVKGAQGILATIRVNEPLICGLSNFIDYASSRIISEMAKQNTLRLSRHRSFNKRFARFCELPRNRLLLTVTPEA